MDTHANKNQENKRESQTEQSAKQQHKKNATFQFVDNRPEAKHQRSLIEMMNNSNQVKQLRKVQEMADRYTARLQHPIQKKGNNTGLPDNLKAGIENLSGYSMDDVKVHYNSDNPAQLNAHAYAQGTDIHLASGQEKHLPHEAWHVVQQKQGRVKPTMQMKGGVDVNDDEGLEKEADVMGDRIYTNFMREIDRNKTESNGSNKSTTIIQGRWEDSGFGYYGKMLQDIYLQQGPVDTSHQQTPASCWRECFSIVSGRERREVGALAPDSAMESGLGQGGFDFEANDGLASRLGLLKIDFPYTMDNFITHFQQNENQLPYVVGLINRKHYVVLLNVGIPLKRNFTKSEIRITYWEPLIGELLTTDFDTFSTWIPAHVYYKP